MLTGTRTQFIAHNTILNRKGYDINKSESNDVMTKERFRFLFFINLEKILFSKSRITKNYVLGHDWTKTKKSDSTWSWITSWTKSIFSCKHETDSTLYWSITEGIKSLALTKISLND